MEGMVANCTLDYGRIDPRQFGDSLCKWRSLLKWTSCIPYIIWWLYIWLAY
jgi:hypothetical protein